MPSVKTLAFATTLFTIGTGAVALAQSDYSAFINARQGHMQIMSFNSGILGNMVRGNTEYDAVAAQTAADNLAALATVDGRPYWAPGSDSAAVEGTRALPAIWENPAEFGADWGAYAQAVTAVQAAAGTGLDDLRVALGPLGSACGACHDDFRQPR